MTIVLKQNSKLESERQLDRLETQGSRRGVRLAAGRTILAAGLVFGTAGALTVATTGAQAFGLGDITGAVTGVAKGAIDAAGRTVAGRVVKGAAKKVDSALRNGVNVGGVNIRPACPYFVGCKVDSKGRIVIDVSKRKRTKVRVTTRGESKLPPPRRANERVPVKRPPVREVIGITKDDLKPSKTCKAMHCKPGNDKRQEAKRDVPRDKSIWGRPVGGKTKRIIRVRDHRKSSGDAKRTVRVRDHRKSSGKTDTVIRLRDQRKSSGAAKRIIRDKRKRVSNSRRR